MSVSGIATAGLIFGLLSFIIIIGALILYFVDRGTILPPLTTNVFNGSANSTTANKLYNTVFLYAPTSGPTGTNPFTLTLNTDPTNVSGGIFYVTNANTFSQAPVQVLSGSGFTLNKVQSGTISIRPGSSGVFVFNALNSATFMGYLNSVNT